MAYATWRPGGFGLGVHRAALFQRAVRCGAGGRRRGAHRRAGRRASTGSGRRRCATRAAAATGRSTSWSVADGSASTPARPGCGPRARAPVYPWGAVWANARDAGGAFAGALSQRYRPRRDDDRRAARRRAPDGASDLVSFFWSLPVAELDGFFTRRLRRRGGARCWQALARGRAPRRPVRRTGRLQPRDLPRRERGPLVRRPSSRRRCGPTTRDIPGGRTREAQPSGRLIWRMADRAAVHGRLGHRPRRGALASTRKSVA